MAHAINRDPRIALRYVVRRLNFPVYRSLADTPWLNPGEEP